MVPAALPYSYPTQDQVHTVWDKDLIERPQSTLQALYAFLGVPMIQLPSWDKDDVENMVAEVYVVRGW